MQTIFHCHSNDNFVNMLCAVTKHSPVLLNVGFFHLFLEICVLLMWEAFIYVCGDKCMFEIMIT